MNDLAQPVIQGGRRCEYLFQLMEDRGRLLYVSSVAGGDYDTFRLFLGIAPQLLAVPIDDVTRYRDGGTTVMNTAVGILVAPAQQHDEEPTWMVEDDENVDLVPLDPDQYMISETEPHVTIHPKCGRIAEPKAETDEHRQESDV
jgi:hypothetical protein